ncbi:MAG: DUF4974 domain-containing protein [Bacteroidales bacterium]|nr:DUF4974 domain-containing protein [Bacteroidales bacterium]MBN2818578.1 DUF4974 domain-containing protein [Bacteroidales bacterium]
MTLPDIPYKIAGLIYKQMRNEISDAENTTLNEWLNSSDKQTELYNKITNDEAIAKKLKLYKKFNENTAWNKFEKQLEIKAKSTSRSMFRIISYAAAVIIPLFIASYLFLFEKEKPAIDDIIVPGTHMAVLTLSDGKEINLDGSETKQTIDNEQVYIYNQERILKYELKDEENSSAPENNAKSVEPRFNTLTIPRGGEYSIELTDGTKIWLNAESKLVYPIEFTGNNRQIYIEGEAYLEVAHNSVKPFIVNTSLVNITVLGTSFNIRSYENDPEIVTTLVEGKVKLTGISTNNHEQIVLSPGKQARMIKTTKTLEISEVETNDYTAWKDGLLVFNNENLGSIMKRLERWYNFNSIFESEELRELHFSGTLNKYDHIDTILDMISISCYIQFKSEGRNITVIKKPNNK